MPTRPGTTKSSSSTAQSSTSQLTKTTPRIWFAKAQPVVPPCDSWDDEPGMKPTSIVEVDAAGCIAPPGTELCVMSQPAPAADPVVVSKSAPAASQSAEFIPGVPWRSKNEDNNWCILPPRLPATLPAPALLAQNFQVDRPSLAQGAALAENPDDPAVLESTRQKDMDAALLLADGTAPQPNQGGSRQKVRADGQCDSWTFQERRKNTGREWWSDSYQNGGDW